MLINLSNHPQKNWTIAQLGAAKEQFGIIMDMPFPPINPYATKEEVRALGMEYFRKIINILDECANEPLQNAVHIQGEFTFVYNLVTMLKSAGIKSVASTSERKVEEVDGKKIVEFNFVQFREY